MAIDDAQIKAIALQQALKHNAPKPVFRGMVKGEATYGDWKDGLSDDAINVVLGAVNSAMSPEQRQAHLISLGINNEKAKPVYTEKQEEIIERMSPKVSYSKDIFGF